ncbi:MAG: IS1634 family transposase [Thiobacillaceae bacterium]
MGSSPTGPTNHPTGAQVIVRVLIYLSRRIGKPDFHRSRPGSVIFGSEWRLHRHWFDVSAMADLLGGDFTLAQKNTLYRCLDKLVAHKDALFKFLCERWGELFGAKFDVLLYDLTSTYFETDTLRDEGDKRQYGYSRDKRFDCRRVVIGLIVTPEGFSLSYEVLAGNSADSTTLGDFLNRIDVPAVATGARWHRGQASGSGRRHLRARAQ